jgi:hypothetical protein
MLPAVCRTLFDAKPKFNAFLQSVIQGKITAVALPPKEEIVPDDLFFAAPEDSHMPEQVPVPSKRRGQSSAKGGKRQKRR